MSSEHLDHLQYIRSDLHVRHIDNRLHGYSLNEFAESASSATEYDESFLYMALGELTARLDETIEEDPAYLDLLEAYYQVAGAISKIVKINAAEDAAIKQARDLLGDN